MVERAPADVLPCVGDGLKSGALSFLVNLFLVWRPVGEVYMRPVKRSYVDKGRSAQKFRGDTARTKAANMRPPPMRGGFRL